MSGQKQIKQLARQLYKLSFVDGRLSDERVAGVLEYIEKNQPAHLLAILKSYHRLISAEVSRNQAIIEHAGVVSQQTIQSIGAGLAKKYGRPIVAFAKANPELLAGLRVRVGDDVYESSVAGQLSQLASSV